MDLADLAEATLAVTRRMRISPRSPLDVTVACVHGAASPDLGEVRLDARDVTPRVMI